MLDLEGILVTKRRRPILVKDVLSLATLETSGKNIGVAGAVVIACLIPFNGALTKLTFGDKQVVTMMTTEMTEANFSGELESYEAQIVAAVIPKCMEVPEYPLPTLADTPSGNRAILSVNLLKNSIGVDQAEALVGALKEHPTPSSRSAGTRATRPSSI
jgi:hypothetical protein